MENYKPKIGDIVIAEVRSYGVLELMLVNDPDDRRGVFSMFRQEPCWFCEKRQEFFSKTIVNPIKLKGNDFEKAQKIDLKGY